MTRRCITAALILLLSACDTSAEPADAAPAAIDAGPRLDSGPRSDAGIPEDLDGFVEHWMSYGGIPGAALAVVTPDGIPLTRTYGYADIESERAVDVNTLFALASISKTLTAVRAMQLAQAGMLDLDAPIGAYLGYDVEHPLHLGLPVSTRMLLSHVSGLEDNFARLGEVTYVGDATMTLDEFAREYLLVGGSLYSDTNWGEPPGTLRSYSNAGFGVIGRILERAGGAPLPDQTEAALFAPIDMDGAAWTLADIDLARVATPYSWNGRRFSALPHNGYAYYPASTARMSIIGLARFTQMLLGDGEIEGTRVLEAATVEAMLSIQYPDVDRGQAIAFSERVVDGHRFIGHSGTTFGGSTQLLMRRGGAYAIVLLTNSDAHLRSRVLGREEGRDAMNAILVRLDQEADSL